MGWIHKERLVSNGKIKNLQKQGLALEVKLKLFRPIISRIMSSFECLQSLLVTKFIFDVSFLPYSWILKRYCEWMSSFLSTVNEYFSFYLYLKDAGKFLRALQKKLTNPANIGLIVSEGIKRSSRYCNLVVAYFFFCFCVCYSEWLCNYYCET